MKPRRTWTLRTRLLLALLALMAAGLTVFGSVSVALLDRSLVDRIDASLRTIGDRLSAADRPPLQPPARISANDRLPTDFRILFFDQTGRLADRVGQGNNEGTFPALPPMDISSVRQRDGHAFTVPDESGRGRWRVSTAIQAPTPTQPVSGTVAVALSLDTTDATASRLRTIELVGGAVLLIFLGITGTWLVRLGLRPLTRIEHAAKAITDGQLDRRLSEDDPRTETGQLAAAFNVMLDHVASALRKREQSEDRLRRFVADASHELRTPLTSIRGFAELYRQSIGSAEVDVPRLMDRIESGATQMGLLVDDLLLLAKLDQERMVDFTEVDLEAIAADAVHDAQAREPGRRITFTPASGPVHVLGDEHRLRQVAANLVDNALVHTPASAAVEVAVRHQSAQVRPACVVQAGEPPSTSSTWAVLEVSDNGPGVAADSAPHVFDRFYRAGRTRARPGSTGLGLAIAAAILSAHSGCIALLNTPEGGATFRVLLAPA